MSTSTETVHVNAPSPRARVRPELDLTATLEPGFCLMLEAEEATSQRLLRSASLGEITVLPGWEDEEDEEDEDEDDGGE